MFLLDCAKIQKFEAGDFLVMNAPKAEDTKKHRAEGEQRIPSFQEAAASPLPIYRALIHNHFNNLPKKKTPLLFLDAGCVSY